MLAGYSRRILRSRMLRVATFILAFWTLLETFHIHRLLLETASTPVERGKTEKVFIASLPWNNEIILRTHLVDQIRDVIHALGIPNVYISVYENGSFDKTAEVLRELHRELEDLGVRNRVILDETSHEDIIKARPTAPKEGWIKMERSGFELKGIRKGDYTLRRIYYLAQLRNRVLEPLTELAEKGETFDKILFLNDVVFTSDDVLNLLQTRDGKYGAACTLDFESPPAFYDTFALRDSSGDPAIMQTWPFFRSAASRNALIANQPVPVQSCWNGIVAMPAAPFYDKATPLRFRGVPDSLAHDHIEGSECCLIHADNRLSSSLGVWVNPNVRVGYCHPDLHKPEKNTFAHDWDIFKHACQMAYDEVHPSGAGSWVSYFQIARGLWENRLRRWTSLGVSMQNWKLRRKLQAWEAESETHEEVGNVCLVDEMHIIS
ncbi:hypothetical protein LTR37_002498 [Vermiconidia calcicola]|uniref:Uncharacterized protein n=1 Tax=Vermiconidia calcicola TaxID=1690605 RepID=A0ACC3NSZ9_9PEZI|nr:hypothetical protein LTR37_002498 [Vermiconidia calcicola]